MFMFAFILAFASTCFELMLAAKIPVLRRMSHKSITFNLINSMVISWVVGIMFGAAGLIAMTAGILSTLMSIPGYYILYWMYDSPQAKANGGNQLQYQKQKLAKEFNKWSIALKDLFKLIYKIIRIITFPFWFLRYCLVKYTAYKNRTTVSA